MAILAFYQGSIAVLEHTSNMSTYLKIINLIIR